MQELQKPAKPMDTVSPRIVIVEQPASRALRFRYQCEGRLAGSIPGVTSSGDNKTFPTIKIENYSGKAYVVVSCVTDDDPHRYAMIAILILTVPESARGRWARQWM